MRTTLLLLLGIAVLVVVGLAPFAWALDDWPWHGDGMLWIMNGTLQDAGFIEFVGSQHFIGWRPLTAITFVANHALFGFDITAYRAVDFALHGACAFAIAWVFARLVPEPGAWPLLPAALFVAHPAAGHVLPYLARRSYSLSLLCALLAIVALTWRRDIVAALLVGLSIAANEVGLVMVGVLVLLAANSEQDARRTAVRLAPTVLVAVVLVALRMVIVQDGVGGYADASIHTADLTGKQVVRKGVGPVPILLTALSQAIAPMTSDGRYPWSAHVPGARLTVLAAWFLLLLPARDWRDERARIGPILALWGVGYLVLYVVAGTWFPRQVHPLATPTILLLSWSIVQAVRARDRVSVVLGGAAVLVLTSLLHTTPLLGAEPARQLKARQRASEAIEGVLPLLDPVPAEAVGLLVLPGGKDGAPMVKNWLDRLAPRSGDAAWRVVATSAREGRTKYDVDTKVLGVSDKVVLRDAYAVQEVPEEERYTRRLQLRRLRPHHLDRAVFFDDERGWTLVPLASRRRK